MLKSNFKNFQTGVPRAVLGEPVLRTPRRRTSRCWGFTLVELLVVVSIISTLASTVLASLNSARAKARDAAKIQTVEEYKKALFFVYDKYGSYPNPGAAGTVCLGDYPDDRCGWNNLRPENATVNGQVDDFLPSLPSTGGTFAILRTFPSVQTLMDGIDYRCTASPGGVCIKAEIRWATEKDVDCRGGITDTSWANYCSFPFD